MARDRKHITPKTKLAAAIGALFLTYDERKLLSEDQVLSLVHWDHDPIPHAEDGTDDHFNLTPALIGGHRVKTATVDIPGIAKRKRVSEAEQAFRNRLLAKTQPDAAQVVPSRPKRTMQSRPFQQKGRKHGHSKKRTSR